MKAKLQQLELDLDAPVNPPPPRSLRQMHAVYGVAEPERWCRGCVHLQRRSAGNSSFWKCQKHRTSSSATTDWRLSWRACGLWAERADTPE